MASQLENVSACTYTQMDGEHKNNTTVAMAWAAEVQAV